MKNEKKTRLILEIVFVSLSNRVVTVLYAHQDVTSDNIILKRRNGPLSEINQIIPEGVKKFKNHKSGFHMKT